MRDNSHQGDIRVRGVEDAQNSTFKDVLELHTINNQLLKKEGYEGKQSRRFHLRLIGLPEGLERSNCVDFLFEKLLIELAHKMPMRKTQPVGFPVQNALCREQGLILHKAKERMPLMYNTKMMIFPDFAKEVQKRQTIFIVKRSHSINYYMLDPAKIKFSYKENSWM